MKSVHDSTIAAMFYALPPAINFARLVGDLDAALADIPHDLRTLAWDCDDVAVFDIDGSRIVLALAERLPGPRKTCLSVAVGPNHNCAAPDRFADRRASVATLIVSRISQRIPPDEVVWHGASGVLDAEALDAATDALLAAREAETAACAAKSSTGAGGAARAVPPVHGPAAFDRLMARLEAEIAGVRAPAQARAAPVSQPAAATAPDARTADLGHGAASAGAAEPARVTLSPARPAAGARAQSRARAAAASAIAIANDVPDLPRPAVAEAARIREALYPPAPPEEGRASTPARLAVGAMGTTLIFVAAPVGAALLTYNALRGADLALTSRAVALTGALLALADLPGLLSLV